MRVWRPAHDNAGGARLRERPGRWASLALVAAGLLCGGCQGMSAEVAPQQRAQLEQRALGLLLRAAQSGLDAVIEANAIEALSDVAPDAGLPAFHAALDSSSPLVRYAGCVALGKLRHLPALKNFRRLLDDPDPRVRLAAAFAAYRCGDRGQARLLVQMMNDHPDEKVRAEAARLIGELGEPKALKRLRLAAMREQSDYVIVHIESAMAKLKDRDSLDRIIQYALKSDAVTILLSLQTLAELADPRARRALEYRLHNEADYLQMRLLAARALGRLGVDDGYELALSALNHKARDANETMQIRSNAALALGAIGRADALAALKHLAETESDARTQVAACYAICQIIRAARTSQP